MQLSHIITILFSSTIFTPTLACKCFVNGIQDDAGTMRCCVQLNGVFRNGNDCLASSISERLSNFRACCGGNSDCDYPSPDEATEQDYIKTIVVV
ncbi:hypothetical protein DL767_003280 [Monosporascus sp. MG133]|nr:hypothetical protein DL767_003280 [Monosporascus sp. MG133]